MVWSGAAVGEVGAVSPFLHCFGGDVVFGGQLDKTVALMELVVKLPALVHREPCVLV